MSFCIWDGVFVTWDGTFDVWDEVSCNVITKIAGFAFMFGLHKLCSKQSLSRSLWKKVHRLEKCTPTPLVALQTNMSYGQRPKVGTLIFLHLSLLNVGSTLLSPKEMDSCNPLPNRGKHFYIPFVTWWVCWCPFSQPHAIVQVSSNVEGGEYCHKPQRLLCSIWEQMSPHPLFFQMSAPTSSKEHGWILTMIDGWETSTDQSIGDHKQTSLCLDKFSFTTAADRCDNKFSICGFLWTSTRCLFWDWDSRTQTSREGFNAVGLSEAWSLPQWQRHLTLSSSILQIPQWGLTSDSDHRIRRIW